jgi:hypothetical protein
MQEVTTDEVDEVSDLHHAQSLLLKALTNMPAYDGSQNFESAMATALVQGLAIFSNDSAKEMLRTALNSVTEHDRKVRYEAEIQEHVAAGGKYVNIYVIDHNNYGGPAEGGWHYTSGTPLSIGFNRNHDDPDYRHHSEQHLRNTTKVNALDDPERVKAYVTKALNAARNGNHTLNELVNEYAIEIKVEDRPAEYWPAVKPHYQ